MMPFERAWLYHAHHAPYQDDIFFWLDLASNCAPPVLELGCGTGRVCRALQEAGIPVMGVDLSPEMLAVLREQEMPQKRVPVFQGDARRLGVSDAAFGLVIFPCNTFGTFDEISRTAILDEVFRVLRPGGEFVVSIPNPLALLEMPARGEPEVEEEFTHPLSGLPVQVSSEWQRTGDRFVQHWLYDTLLPDGGVRREVWESAHYLLPPEIWVQTLDAHGLDVIALYGDFAGTAFHPDADLLILHAEKWA
ncbi:MAG: class I SAM-dependent methyltransferase [Anaerolineae bacterium]|nr:MAG: class I SAM-dependent methyltransferase [Anaerolineae bacterium]